MQHLRRLVARRAARWEERLFVAEGPKLLQEALDAGAHVQTVFVDAGAAGPEHRTLAERAALTGASIRELEAGVLARVAGTVTPQPLVAVVAMVDLPWENLPADGLTIVCAGVQDPGNAGTVIRSAAASGSGAVLFCEGAVDIYNPKAVRASAGTLFHLPVALGGRVDQVVGHFRSVGVRTLGTAARDGVEHDRVDWTRPTAVVLGSESHGLPASLGDQLDSLVTIPMEGEAESLNVAMAATVICFEASRQRRAAGRERA